MTSIQLDAPVRRSWWPGLFSFLAALAIGVGSFFIGAAWNAAPVRVEMAPARLERVWTVNVKGDSDARRLRCVEAP